MPPFSAAAFALDGPVVDGDFVLRSGKLFEAGHYADKDFSITPEEMLAAATEFAPVPVDLEHAHTPFLNGKLGELRSVKVGDNGWDLLGTVALPKWLDDALEGTGRKVSATWDRATKRLAGLAIVENPRVTDAALMAAFSVNEIAHAEGDEQTQALDALMAYFAAARHDTPSGRMAMQELHDVAERRGAVCKASNAKMASGHESTAIQKVHDLTMEHGAKCSSLQAYPPAGFPFFSASRRQPPKEGRTVSRFDEFMTWLKGDEGENPPAASTATMSTGESAEMKALRERQTALEAENTRIRAERISDQAVAFADSQIRDLRAYPAEREAIVSDFVQRATDDTLHGTVTFGEGDQKQSTSRVELLRASFAARPQHGLTAEQMKEQGLVTLSNRQTTEHGGQDKPADKQKIDEMIGLTPLGQAHLRQRNGTSSN